MAVHASYSAVAAPNVATIPRLRHIAYWIVSAPVLLETIVGAQWDLTRTPYVREVMLHLGYPLYFVTIMGAAKVLAVVALIVPRFPRLRSGRTQACSLSMSARPRLISPWVTKWPGSSSQPCSR